MLKRFRHSKKSGQALVELAIVFPFFLIIIFGGIIDFGFAFYNFLTLQQLVGDTAKYWAVSGADDMAVAQNYALTQKPSWWSESFLVSADPPEKLQNQGPKLKGGTDSDAYVYKVMASYESPLYTPFYQTLAEKLGGKASLTLRAQASFKKSVYMRQF